MGYGLTCGEELAFTGRYDDPYTGLLLSPAECRQVVVHQRDAQGIGILGSVEFDQSYCGLLRVDSDRYIVEARW